jgi:hypothetical protein
LFAIIELERNATHLETLAGAKPGPSCLPDFDSFSLHLGSPGVVHTVVEQPAGGFLRPTAPPPAGFGGSLKRELQQGTVKLGS